MAEIILPPEENEETPQTPELNIDKPTENSKVITIEFEAKKTKKVSTKDTKQQLYTTDTDAWFEFKETSLEGANGTYSVVFRNRHDGSIFQRTGDVANGVAYYKIPHQEIRHAGAWRGQIVYTLSNGDTTAREFGYDVKGHILDGKDVREIVVEDFETLMSQLRSMKDNAELELASLTQQLKNTTDTAEQNETDRQVFFDDLVEDIDELQANYQELLDTGVLQTNINTKLEALEEEYAPKLTEVTAQLAQIAYLKPSGEDDTENIRDILREGKKLRLLKTDEPFKISSSLVKYSDNFSVDIEGQGGKVEIQLISPLDETDVYKNSIFRPDPVNCHFFRLRNLHLIGNWDGLADGGYANSIGVWLTPSENYIADVDNVTTENFYSYGHYFHVNKANIGRIHANNCRTQGVAIVNVRDWLNIDLIEANNNGTIDNDSNMGGGVDIEYTNSQLRPEGLKNVSINTIISKDNTRGVVINGGTLTNSDLTAKNLTLNDFNVSIGSVFVENNYQDGLLIDFPNVTIDFVQSKNNAKRVTAEGGQFAGLLIRNTQPLKKNSILINHVSSENDVVGMTTAGNSDAQFNYENIVINVLNIKHSHRRGIYLASPTAKNFTIHSVTDEQEKEDILPSSKGLRNRIKSGTLHGSTEVIRFKESVSFELELPLTDRFRYLLPPNSQIERILIEVEEAGTGTSRLRVRVGGAIKAQIVRQTVGLRELNLFENNLQSGDEASSPLGVDYKNRTLDFEPTSDPIFDSKILVTIDYTITK